MVSRNGTSCLRTRLSSPAPDSFWPIGAGAARFWALGVWLLCFLGSVGGSAAGFVSDKCFQSRRGPPAAMLCGLVLILSLVMAASLRSSPVLVGASGVGIVIDRKR